jgi:hypothetical protein
VKRQLSFAALPPPPPSLLLLNLKPYKQVLFHTTDLNKSSESILITLSLHLSTGAKRVQINEIPAMKQRISRVSLLCPLSLRLPNPLFLFSKLLSYFRLFFGSYRGPTTCTRGSRRLQIPTAVGHGGWACRHSPRRIAINRHGPRWLWRSNLINF